MHKGKWNSRFPFFFATTLYQTDESLNMIAEGKHKTKIITLQRFAKTDELHISER